MYIIIYHKKIIIIFLITKIHKFNSNICEKKYDINFGINDSTFVSKLEINSISCWVLAIPTKICKI